ncbi:MAG: hypothetical protein CMJ83_06515 [Planctomycetes bacterium]|nr:hypothetical protein [Planctomycetota bacterium]
MFRSVVLASVLVVSSLPGQPAVDLGTRRELFADRFLIDTLDGARLKPGQPIDEGPVFRFDQPWEGPFCGYATVIRDGDRFLLYYRGLPRAGKDGTDQEKTCIATSRDGLGWTRPDLRLFGTAGSKHNNVILANAAPVTHNFSPFLDTRPAVAKEHRFKALGGNQRSGLVAYTSADGLVWRRLQKAPVFTKGAFDSQNVSFWSEHEDCYVCYFRTWTGGDYSGFRTVSRTTSRDFVHWTDPKEMSFGNTPREHIYTSQTHPYFRAPHLYVGVAARFMPGRQVVSAAQARLLKVEPRYFRDCSDAVLLTSRGGHRYSRTFMEGFIRPGIGLQNWVSRSNYPALNVVRTGPDEMSLYVNQDYAQPTAHIRRYSMRLDGFGSVSAPYAGGQMLTRPVRFGGGRLTINFASSAAGGIRVELQDAAGKPIPGFTLADSIEQIGNEISRIVAWKAGTDLSRIAGTPVRLRFVLRDADLFALKFSQ